MVAPSLPPGFTKHHVVHLEAVHAPLPKFDIEYDLTSYRTTTSDQVAERIKGATIVVATVCPVTKTDLETALNLQCIVILATGIGWVDKPYCASRGITIVNCPHSNIEALGEHFLALYFASRRKIPDLHRKVTTSREWLETHEVLGQWPQGPPLSCAMEILGIVGYGALGRRFEGLAKAVGFGKIIISERKGVTEAREGRVTFEELVKTASTIVICCPKEPSTIDLIGESEIQLMREQVLILNMARGGIVNEGALAEALKSGRIFGAATDVLNTEPGGPGTSPLLPDPSRGEAPIPNLIITPHVAWYAEKTMRMLAMLVADGVESFAKGNLETGDGVKHTVAVYKGKIWK